MRVSAAEMIATVDSEEPVCSGGQPNRSGSQEQWEAEELRAWQADAKSMMDFWDDQDRHQEQQRLDTLRAKEWDDWAMHDALTTGPTLKRRRLIVQTFAKTGPGSGPATPTRSPSRTMECGRKWRQNGWWWKLAFRSTSGPSADSPCGAIVGESQEPTGSTLPSVAGVSEGEKNGAADDGEEKDVETMMEGQS
eukprot:s1037_g13.t1